jgi:hypothetical protein
VEGGDSDVGGEVTRESVRQLLRLVRVLETLSQGEARLDFTRAGGRRWLRLKFTRGSYSRQQVVEITDDVPATVALMVAACRLGVT